MVIISGVPIFRIFTVTANNVDPDQTAPRSSLIRVYIVCKASLKVSGG